MTVLRLPALLVACALVLAACGGDDEDPEPAATTETEPVASVPAPVTTPPPETTATRKDEQADPDREPRTIPLEEQQGDEEPIRSEAVFTGRGGRLTPRVVRVPPFIAIKVILRATDASSQQSYTLTIGGQRLAVGGERQVDEVDLGGLPPERAYRGRSPQGDVRVAASAEPGP